MCLSTKNQSFSFSLLSTLYVHGSTINKLTKFYLEIKACFSKPQSNFTHNSIKPHRNSPQKSTIHCFFSPIFQLCTPFSAKEGKDTTD